MKISELENAPDWLKEAKTVDEDVEIVGGRVIWRDGEWQDGVWQGGLWRGGVWRGGVWHGGVWRDGEWHGSATRQCVILGDDLRGYRFIAEYISELRIKAGCRDFSFDEARAHWESKQYTKNKVLIMHMLEHARRLESALEWRPIK